MNVHIQLIFYCFICSLLIGCQFQPTRYADQAAEVVDSEVELGESKNRDAELAWFDFFEVEQLRLLVQQALRSNSSLEVAWNRLEEARSMAEAAESGLLPRLNLEGGAARSKQRSLPLGLSDQFTQGPVAAILDPEATQQLTVYDAALAASYEIDIWGRIRSQARAADLTVMTQRRNYRALAMTLAANITRRWLQLQSVQLRIEILHQQLKTMQQQIALNDRRLGSGLIQGFEVSRQEQRLNQLQGQLAQSSLEYELVKNQLALLVGRVPQKFAVAATADLPPLGARPPLGLSAELLQRRPDVQAAFTALQAADERIAAAVAAQLPKLTLSAQVFSDATSAGGLGDLIFWTLQAGIKDTLFSGGYEQAQVEAAEARARQALYQYKDAVLQAYRDVADALAKEKQQRKRLRFLRKQLKAARQGQTLSEVSYVNGAASYETFLEAQMRLQELEIEAVKARQFLLVYRLQLHRALGGKWPTAMEKLLSEDGDET